MRYPLLRVEGQGVRPRASGMRNQVCPGGGRVHCTNLWMGGRYPVSHVVPAWWPLHLVPNVTGPIFRLCFATTAGASAFAVWTPRAGDAIARSDSPLHSWDSPNRLAFLSRLYQRCGPTMFQPRNVNEDVELRQRKTPSKMC